MENDRRLAHHGQVEPLLLRAIHRDAVAGVMRHADAGYGIARDCAQEQGLDLPMV